MKALFIGGSKDGDYDECENREFINVPIPPPPISACYTKTLSVHTTMKVQTYWLHLFRAGGTYFHIYALDGMNDLAIMLALINRYKGGK